ncbi:MAG TPA: sugar ABC transporter ATP-binding protein, partial [Rhodothermales bacterium]
MQDDREEVAARLSVRGLYKSYAVPVLTNVNLDVRPGEAHALVGANGAGKSTFSRIVSGLTAADAGSMWIDSQPYAPTSKSDAEARGVQMVMQELNLIRTLSIAENLFLNRLPRRFGFIDYDALRRQTHRALAAVGLQDLDPDRPVYTLGVGHQQLVEIAAALARPCRLLILDEPTAALTDPEIELLFDNVRRLKEQGVSILYISHRMEEILTICDSVTVLRDGNLVSTRSTTSVTIDEIVQQMVGRETVEAMDEHQARQPGEIALRVEGLRRGSELVDVSFDVHHGEILGLAGLVGSGRTE